MGRTLTALGLLCFILLAPAARGAPVAAAAAPQSDADACAKLLGEPAWSARERWVWQRVCRGEAADLGAEHPRPGRELSAAFLETIVATEPYRSAVHQLVRIEGAHFTTKLDLDDRRLDNQLSLIGCQFDADVSLQRAELKRLSFTRSHFRRALILARATIVGSLLLNATRVAGQLVIADATIGGDLMLIDATASGLNAPRISVERTLLLQSGHFDDMTIAQGKVGSLVLKGGDLGAVDAAMLEASKRVLIEGGKGGDLNLLASTIGGMLSIMGSSFESVDFSKSAITGDALLTSLTIARDLHADGTTVHGAFMLTNSTVTGAASLSYLEANDLTISGGSFRTVDLSAAKIKGDFQLSAGAAPLWHDGGSLLLRNASAGAVEDRGPNCPDYAAPSCRDPLPRDLDINGFTYRHLGGLAGASHDARGQSLTGANLRDHWERWLIRQTGFSPQAYDQLATALRGMTYAADATAVQFDAKDRERRAAPPWSVERLLLFLDRWLIGYGYYPYWAGGWALVLLLTGTVAYVLADRSQLVTGQPEELARAEPVVLTGLVYSFDALIPLVTLRKSDNGVMVRGLPGHYFLVHTLAGWLLATFLAVGISGLTTK